ncbi:MAG: cytochrome c oxidase subunit 3 [Gammaproteobacteria bacterium]
MESHAQAADRYFVPHGTHWNIIGSVGLFCLAVGGALWLEKVEPGKWVFLFGWILAFTMAFGWFGTVIHESLSGNYNAQVGRTYRWSMSFFIFSEVMFFGAFFGALFYARVFVEHWLAGSSNSLFTNLVLWKGYTPVWPSSGPAKLGGPFTPMDPTKIAALNTLILLTSGLTVTIAHWGLLKNHRKQLCWFLLFTVILGFAFVALQAREFIDAYLVQNMTLGSGIYGSTFFVLTGFHGCHVCVGAIMLTVLLIRALKGHLTPENHFAFQGISWYWHFVDVVWLCLYVFVYWL